MANIAAWQAATCWSRNVAYVRFTTIKIFSPLPASRQEIAQCVLMYSLGRQVFPVDTHCWRIAGRLGWVRPTQKDKHCAPRDMDRLQSKIPPRVALLVTCEYDFSRREICTASAPCCKECPIAVLCSKIGVSRDKKENGFGARKHNSMIV